MSPLSACARENERRCRQKRVDQVADPHEESGKDQDCKDREPAYGPVDQEQNRDFTQRDHAEDEAAAPVREGQILDVNPQKRHVERQRHLHEEDEDQDQDQRGILEHGAEGCRLFRPLQRHAGQCAHVGEHDQVEYGCVGKDEPEVGVVQYESGQYRGQREGRGAAEADVGVFLVVLRQVVDSVRVT